MFFVINKQKIYTYLVSIVTVLLLFCTATTLNTNQNTIETSSSNQKLLPIYKVNTEEKKIAFTMNCAWNADDIDSILETLKNNNVKITFFMVGDWIDKFPNAVKKINEAGHEIASHSNTHPHVNNLSYQENIDEIEKSNDKIENLTGNRTKIYRAPYGEYNNTVIQAANDKGYYTIQWSLDTLDYKGLSGDEMWKRLEENLQPGDIILSHNGTKHTADSLDMLLKNIKKKGFEVVRVSDLIYEANYTIDNNGTQNKDF
jgi:peptidoglycan/xylan/chitin deacetylase (PgdA/CDA1 family)